MFRDLKDNDKNRLWVIHDNCLMLPEYFVEFQYAQNLFKGDKVYQIGNQLSNTFATLMLTTSQSITGKWQGNFHHAKQLR